MKIAGEIVGGDRRQRRREKFQKILMKILVTRAWPPYVYFAIALIKRRKKTQAIDVIHMTMGDENIDAGGLAFELFAQSANTGTRIENYCTFLVVDELYARGVATATQSLWPWSGKRPARSPYFNFDHQRFSKEIISLLEISVRAFFSQHHGEPYDAKLKQRTCACGS